MFVSYPRSSLLHSFIPIFSLYTTTLPIPLHSLILPKPLHLPILTSITPPKSAIHAHILILMHGWKSKTPCHHCDEWKISTTSIWLKRWQPVSNLRSCGLHLWRRAKWFCWIWRAFVIDYCFLMWRTHQGKCTTKRQWRDESSMCMRCVWSFFSVYRNERVRSHHDQLKIVISSGLKGILELLDAAEIKSIPVKEYIGLTHN